MLRLIVMSAASNYVGNLGSTATNLRTCSIFKMLSMNTTATDIQISAVTVEAYKSACFGVLIEDGFMLRLEEINQQLVRLLVMNQVKSAAFTTACNPFIQPTTDC